MFEDARFEAEVTGCGIVESGQVEEAERHAGGVTGVTGVTSVTSVTVRFFPLAVVVQREHRAAMRYRLDVILIHVVRFEQRPL